MLFRAPVKTERVGRAASQLKVFPAPIGGWVANRNIAQPQQPGQPQAAVVLDNFFPLATSAVLRRGSTIYATLGQDDSPATALFAYSAGETEKLFGATATTIYDITTVLEPDNVVMIDDEEDIIVDDLGNDIGWFSTAGLEVWEGYTGGNWITTQFATSGDVFLVGVNGVDEGFIYDGDNFFPWVAGGIRLLHYDALVNDFAVGEVVTGGTSGATGTIIKVVENGSQGTLWLRDVTGAFQDNETIEDSDTGEATADGADVVGAPGPTFPGGLTTADMSFVFSYGRRLFFVRKNTLEYYYLPVDQVGGSASVGYLGAVFGLGGTLVLGQSWSTDGGGGLSAQCVFASTEGEVAVYQGLDPGDANDWRVVGTYRVGVPLGPRAFIRAGGDLVLASSVGFVPLSQAVARDYAALFQSAVSYNIEDAWNTATADRGMSSWHCTLWPEGQMVLVVPPFGVDNDPVIFAANARTGAWARFTNWRATCSVVFRGSLYFGSDTGQVLLGNVGGTDNGINYTGDYKPLFEDFGASAALKVGQMARPVLRAASPLNTSVRLFTDFDIDETPPPAASIAAGGSEWNVGIWGQSVWGGKRKSVITQDWKSIGGLGYALSVGLQVTSGSVAPLDVEIIRTEVTFQTADIAT